MSVRIAVEREAGADPAVPLPGFATDGAAGADVRANLPEGEREAGLTLEPGARALVPTGMRMAIPQGYEVQVRPRSGLALKQGLTVANAPGTIDSDYRGPVGVILVNLGSAPVRIAHGDRIAQLIVAPVVRGVFDEVATLDETARGEGGFGSTGVG
jgi:dUTP pyrophosphatase